jgi:hypothetical protein
VRISAVIDRLAVKTNASDMPQDVKDTIADRLAACRELVREFLPYDWPSVVDDLDVSIDQAGHLSAGFAAKAIQRFRDEQTGGQTAAILTTIAGYLTIIEGDFRWHDSQSKANA